MGRDVLTLAKREMNRRHFATAIQMLEAKADIYDENFEYYLTLGIACLYAGDVGTAALYFQRARNIKLTDTRLLLGQAAIFLRRGDTKRALQYYLDIRENDPENKIAAQAMEFIRVHGDYDKICRWVDTGRIEQFYPALGFNPDKLVIFIAPVLACALGIALAFVIIPRNKNVTIGPRADLSKLELSADDKKQAKEDDLSNQNYKYILSSKDIVKKYNDALSYFQEHRDNAAQVEINYILNSDASLSIKQNAQILMGLLEKPTFDSITDVPFFSEVNDNPALYLDCWVDWGGRISNSINYPDGTYSCDLLVGDEQMEHYEGSVNVKFESAPVPAIDGKSGARILGQISTDGNTIYLKGKSVFQSIH